MASSETESVELKETVVKLSNNGSQIGSEAVPERGNTALSPNDVKEWSADKLENFLDSKISLVEAEGTTILLLYHAGNALGFWICRCRCILESSGSQNSGCS